MPCTAPEAALPWPIPQPRPARPIARPAPSATPHVLDGPPTWANAMSGASTRAATANRNPTAMRIGMNLLRGRAESVRVRMRLFDRLPDVDDGEEREDEGLNEGHEKAE